MRDKPRDFTWGVLSPVPPVLLMSEYYWRYHRALLSLWLWLLQKGLNPVTTELSTGSYFHITSRLHGGQRAGKTLEEIERQ